MAKRYVKRAASHLGIGEKSVRNYFEEVQQFLHPWPSFKIISRAILEGSRNDLPEQVAQRISENDRKFKLTWDKKITQVRNELKKYIVPLPSNHILKDALSSFDKKPRIPDLANKIINESHDYISTKDRELYERIHEFLFPAISVREISKFLEKNPDLSEPEDIAEQIARQNKGYELKYILDRIKNQIYPEIRIKQIVDYSESFLDEELIEVIVDRIIHDPDTEFVDAEKKELIENAVDEIYPVIKVETAAKLFKKFSDISSSEDLIDSICEHDDGFIRRDHTPLFEAIKSMIYPELSIPDFKRLIINYPDLSAEELADLICDRGNRYFPISLINAVRERLYPRASTRVIYKGIQKNPGVETIGELSKLIANFNHELILAEEVDLFQKVRSKTYPEINIIHFSKVRKILPDEQNPSKLAEWVTNKWRKYQDIRHLREAQGLIYPEPKIQRLYEFAKRKKSINDPDSLAFLFSKRSSDFSYFTRWEMKICKETRSRLHPEPGLDFILDCLKKYSFDDPSALAEEIIENNPKTYLPREEYENCLGIKKHIFPGPELPEIYQFKKDSSRRTAESIAAEFVNTQADEFILSRDKSFCIQVQRLLYPEPGLTFIFQEMNKVEGGDAEVVAKQILLNYPDKFIPENKKEFCEEVQDYISPDPTLPEIYLFIRDNAGFHPARIADIFVKKHQGKYFHFSELRKMNKIQSLLYPEISLGKISEYIKKYPYLKHPEEFASAIAKNDPDYTLAKDKYKNMGWYG